MALNNSELFTSENSTPETRGWIFAKTTSRLKELKHTVTQSVETLKRGFGNRVNMILAATTLATATPMIAEKAEASTPTPNTITALAKAPAQPTLDILNYPIVITNKGVNAFQVKGLIPVPDNASKKVYFTQKPDPKKPTRMIKEFPTCLCEGTTYYLSAKAPGTFNIPVTVPSLFRVPQSSSTPLSRVQSVKPLGVTPSLLDEFVSLSDSMRTDSNLLVAAQSEAATANAQAQTNRTRLAEAQADETSIESQLADLRRQYDEAQSALASIDVVTYEKAAAYVASFNALITSTRSPSDKLSALKALDRQHSTLPENPNLDDLSDRIPTLHHDVDTAIDTHNQQVYDDRINADNTTVDQWFTAEAKKTLKASFDSISDLTTLTGPQLFEIFESAEMRTKYADLIPKLDALYQAEAVLPGLRSDFAGIVARNETPYYIPGELNGEESKFSSFYYRLQVEKEWLIFVRNMRNFCVVNIPVLAPYIQETLTDNDIRNAQGEPVVLPPCPSDNLESLKAYDEFYVANLLPLTATNFPVYFNPIAWENFSILTSWAYYATDFFHQFPEWTLESGVEYKRLTALLNNYYTTQAALSNAEQVATSARTNVYDPYLANGTTTTNNPEALAFIVKYNVSSNLAAQVAGNDINAKISELNFKLENNFLTTNDTAALRTILSQNITRVIANWSNFSAFNPYDVLLTYRWQKIVASANVQRFVSSVGTSLINERKTLDAAISYAQNPEEYSSLLNFYERTLTDIDFSNNPDLAEEAEGIRKLSSSVGWIISYVTDYNQTREFLRSLGYTLPDISTLQDEDDDVMAYDPLEAFIISRYTYDQLVQNWLPTPLCDSLIPNLFWSYYARDISSIPDLDFDNLLGVEQQAKDKICNFYLKLLNTNILTPSLRQVVEAQLDRATRTLPAPSQTPDTLSAPYNAANATMDSIDYDGAIRLDGIMSNIQQRVNAIIPVLSNAHTRTVNTASQSAQTESILSNKVSAAKTIADRLTAAQARFDSAGITPSPLYAPGNTNAPVTTLLSSTKDKLPDVLDVSMKIPGTADFYQIIVKKIDVDFFKTSGIALMISDYGKIVAEFEAYRATLSTTNRAHKTEIKNCENYKKKILDPYPKAIQYAIKLHQLPTAPLLSYTDWKKTIVR